MRRPLRPTKSAVSSGFGAGCRAPCSQACNASRPCGPPARCAPCGPCRAPAPCGPRGRGRVRSRPISSASRRPEEYSSSMIARSRVTRASPGGQLEQARHLIRIQRLRQLARGFRRADLDGRIALEHALAHQEVEEAAHGARAAAECCAARGPPACERAANTRTCWLSSARQSSSSLRVAILHQRGEIARVVGIRVAGQPPLGGEVAAEVRDPLERGGCHARSAAFQRVRDQVRHPGEELGAHAGMEAVAVARCRARAGRASPSRPAARARPSRSRSLRCRTGTRAACRAPGRNAACRSRTGISKDFRCGSSAVSVRRKRSSSDCISHADQQQHGIEGVEVLAQARLRCSASTLFARGGAQQAAREAVHAVRRCASLARATRTNSASFSSSARLLLAQHFDLALDQRDGGAAARVRQAQPCQQVLMTLEEIRDSAAR